MKGLIFDIRRFSVHDGPGIRTSVFMKGCPMSCWWCHNPESRSNECEVYTESHQLDSLEFSRQVTIGREMETAELMQELEKDMVFMNESGGGVSFSGGEPLYQAAFLREVLVECHSRNIHTTIDTTGYAKRKLVEDILAYTNLFLFDIKHMDAKTHAEYTGVSNELILENLKMIAEAGKRLWIRLPLIENINDQAENINAVASYLHSLSGPVELINILPYHTIGKSKYSKFGKENKMGSTGNYPAEKSESIRKFLMNEGFKVKIGG